MHDLLRMIILLFGDKRFKIFIYCVSAVIILSIGYAVLKPRYIDEWRECGWRTCVTENDDFIHVGRIATRGSETFVRLIQEQMLSDSTAPVVVRVDSVGGDFGKAMAMTEALRSLEAQRPVRIEVLAGGRCESMCSVLWTAAAERAAAPEARFMFHGPAFGPRRKPGAGLEADAAAMEHAIRRVDPVLADFLKARQGFAPAGPKVELTAAEIAALGGDYLRLDPALR